MNILLIGRISYSVKDGPFLPLKRVGSTVVNWSVVTVGEWLPTKGSLYRPPTVVQSYNVNCTQAISTYAMKITDS